MSCWRKKKASDNVRTVQQEAKRTQGFRFHIVKGENAGATEPMRFDFPPHTFARIQLRTIRGEQMQACLCSSQLFCNFAGLVHRMTIPDQKDGGFAPNHQTVQKAADHIGIHPFFLDHKPYPAAPVHGADHVETISCTRTAHNGFKNLPARNSEEPSR